MFPTGGGRVYAGLSLPPYPLLSKLSQSVPERKSCQKGEENALKSGLGISRNPVIWGKIKLTEKLRGGVSFLASPPSERG